MVAAALWLLAFLLLLAGTIIAVGHGDSDVAFALAMAFMAHALLCAAGAATMTIRQMFVGQNRLLKEAFKLGREEAEVRRLRP